MTLEQFNKENIERWRWMRKEQACPDCGSSHFSLRRYTIVNQEQYYWKFTCRECQTEIFSIDIENLKGYQQKVMLSKFSKYT